MILLLFSTHAWTLIWPKGGLRSLSLDERADRQDKYQQTPLAQARREILIDLPAEAPVPHFPAWGYLALAQVRKNGYLLP